MNTRRDNLAKLLDSLNQISQEPPDTQVFVIERLYAQAEIERRLLAGLDEGTGLDVMNSSLDKHHWENS